MARVRFEVERGFTKTPNELFAMHELSPTVRFVFVYMLSVPPDWELSAAGIGKAVGINRDTATKALNDLAKVGLVRQTLRPGEPRRPPVRGWDWAWPSFRSEDLPSSAPKRNSSATEDLGYGRSPLRDSSATEDLGCGILPLRKSSAPYKDSLYRYVPNETGSTDKDSKTTKTKKDVDSPDPTPKESRPVLRNFNGYKPPAEPAKPKPQAAAKKPRSRPVDRDYTPEFEAAWGAYGRKGGKTSSFKAWKTALERTTVEVIMAAIPNYLASAKPQAGYTRDFSTWLNDDGWESESAQPPKKGYQGQAGSDRASREEYEDVAKRYPVPWLMKNSAYAGLREGCYAWYWHWNRAEQADWTIEQLVEFGNTPEDADVLQAAFRHGPPEHWIGLLADINIKADA